MEDGGLVVQRLFGALEDGVVVGMSFTTYYYQVLAFKMGGTASNTTYYGRLHGYIYILYNWT